MTLASTAESECTHGSFPGKPHGASARLIVMKDLSGAVISRSRAVFMKGQVWVVKPNTRGADTSACRNRKPAFFE